MHYACAYGHVLRTAKCKTPDEAKKDCFGVVSRVTCIQLPKAWKYLTIKQKTELESKLAKLHFEQTGNVLAGYEGKL